MSLNPAMNNTSNGRKWQSSYEFYCQTATRRPRITNTAVEDKNIPNHYIQASMNQDHNIRPLRLYSRRMATTKTMSEQGTSFFCNRCQLAPGTLLENECFVCWESQVWRLLTGWLLPPYGSDREGIFVFVLERWLSASNNTEDALVPEREWSIE